MARKHPQLRVGVFAELFVELFVEVVVVVGGGGGVVNVLLCGGGVALPGGGRGFGGSGGSRLGRGVLIVEALAAALPRPALLAHGTKRRANEAPSAAHSGVPEPRRPNHEFFFFFFFVLVLVLVFFVIIALVLWG